MVCAAIIFVIIITELPAVNVPLLEKSPPNVRPKLFVSSLAPLSMISGADKFKTLAAFNVIIPALVIVTPPEELNGVIHSCPTTIADTLL